MTCDLAFLRKVVAQGLLTARGRAKLSPANQRGQGPFNGWQTSKGAPLEFRSAGEFDRRGERHHGSAVQGDVTSDFGRAVTEPIRCEFPAVRISGTHSSVVLDPADRLQYRFATGGFSYVGGGRVGLHSPP